MRVDPYVTSDVRGVIPVDEIGWTSCIHKPFLDQGSNGGCCNRPRPVCQLFLWQSALGNSFTGSGSGTLLNPCRRHFDSLAARDLPIIDRVVLCLFPVCLSLRSGNEHRDHELLFVSRHRGIPLLEGDRVVILNPDNWPGKVRLALRDESHAVSTSYSHSFIESSLFLGKEDGVFNDVFRSAIGVREGLVAYLTTSA